MLKCQVGEDGKISIRNIRRDANDQLKKQKESGLSEDNFKRALDNTQELTDKYIKKIDGLISAKEVDILN